MARAAARPPHAPMRETSALGRVSQLGPPAAGLRPQAPWGGVRPASGLRGGPVGADGQHPMLSSSWAAVAARRVAPLPTATAPSSGAGGGAAAASSIGGGDGGAPVSMPIVDADGFYTADGRGRAVRGPMPAQRSDPPAGDAQAAEAAPAAADGEPAYLAAAADEAMAQDTCDDGTPIDGAEPHRPTADELRERLARDQRVLEFIVQQGFANDDPTRVAAVQQVAAAKAALQGATPGVAITKRLVWAEKALLRARRSQANMEQAIADLDDDYQRERDERMAKLHQLRARTKEREGKLAEVSRQAAAAFQSPASADGGGTELREAVGTIDGPIRDAVLEAMGQAPEGSPLRTRLAGALGTLDELRGMVTRAARPRWADEYDMADSDDEHAWRHEEDGEQQQYAGDGWQDHADGYWDGWGSWRQRLPHSTYPGGAGDNAMDTSDAQAPHWISGQGNAATGPSWDRAWKRGRRATQDVHGMQGRHVAPEGADVADHEDTARLQAAHQDAAASAAAATAPSPAPPTPVAADNPALERRKQAVWDMAQDQGVAIASEDIARMSSGELEDWAIANLDQL